MKKLIWILGYTAIFFLLSCKSVYEKQGDEHLKNGKYLKALKRYQYVQRKKNGTKNFETNLIKAYIGAMELTAQTDPSIDKLLSFQEKIKKLMENVSSNEIQQLFAKSASNISKNLIFSGEYASEEVGFYLLNDAESIPNLSADIKLVISGIKDEYITKNMNDAQKHLTASINGGAEDGEGIIADYILSKTSLFVNPSDAMKELWSQVRKENLSTYLMYDLENLIDNPVPRVNQYGVLLAIRSFIRKGEKVIIQVQAFNGSTQIFKFIGDGFKLIDSEGKKYEPTAKSGSFSNKNDILLGQETEVGQLSFNVPKDLQLTALQFESKGGITIKYLP